MFIDFIFYKYIPNEDLLRSYEPINFSKKPTPPDPPVPPKPSLDGGEYITEYFDVIEPINYSSYITGLFDTIDLINGSEYCTNEFDVIDFICGYEYSTDLFDTIDLINGSEYCTNEFDVIDDTITIGGNIEGSVDHLWYINKPWSLMQIDS